MALKIIEENISFDTYKEIMSDEIKKKIDEDNSCIFITPSKGWRDNQNWLYPKESADFVKFVNQDYSVNPLLDF